MGFTFFANFEKQTYWTFPIKNLDKTERLELVLEILSWIHNFS